jgi:Ribosomal protein L10
VVLMGKNTLMKRCIRLYCERTGDEKWPPLLEQLVGNVGLVFTKGDLSHVRHSISSGDFACLSRSLCQCLTVEDVMSVLAC